MGIALREPGLRRALADDHVRIRREYGVPARAGGLQADVIATTRGAARLRDRIPLWRPGEWRRGALRRIDDRGRARPLRWDGPPALTRRRVLFGGLPEGFGF